MQRTYCLTEEDIKAAIESYCQQQDGEESTKRWSVVLIVTQGMGDNVTATATAKEKG